MDELRKAQREKGSRREPEQILDRAIYSLWETINDLEQIQPENVEYYRVSIFGSSRIRPGDPIYEDVKRISSELAALGIDIVTGGGPGLMEAANAGAMEGSSGTGRSFGLPIHLPFEEAANPFVDQVFRHRTFFSRLHHFVRLSSAFVVMPGGIGTALELFMVWQLLQVKHIKSRPLYMVGPMWHGLVEWMHETMLERGYVSPGDVEVARVVDSAADVVPLLTESFNLFKDGLKKNDTPKRRTRST